jgi:hypothetical protein
MTQTSRDVLTPLGSEGLRRQKNHIASSVGGESTEAQSQRRIPSKSFKILDAPSLCDDFYLNLVDWSPSNILSVGLGTTVYLWNANTSVVNELVNMGDLN